MIKKLICFIRGHKYRIVQRFGTCSRRIKCTRCNGDWGMNDSVKTIIEWDAELESMYTSFGHTIKEPKY